MYAIHVICYFDDNTNTNFYITYKFSDDLPMYNHEMVEDVILRLSKTELRKLQKINCQAENMPLKVIPMLGYLRDRNGFYHFDYHINDDDDTLLWFKMKQEYLKKPMRAISA